MFVRLHCLYRTVTLLLVFALLFGILPHQVWAGLVPSTSISQAQARLVTPHAEDALATLVQATAAADSDSHLNLPLPELDSLDARAQEQEILINVDAQQAAADARFKPEALSHPISVSRIQSAYRSADAVNGTVVITFTVTNHRPPSVTPTIDPNAPITDTAQMLAEFDPSADPNTIRNVLLTDSLTSGTALVDADPLPNRRGADLTYNLGDIPPRGIVTATLTVQFPTGMSDFAPLDTGAAAWGALRARAVSAETAPATLVSDATGGDWLRWTVDADTRDHYMLEKAAELGQDPIRMFEYVRGLAYESYRGSLRGTRGALWSEAGNSLDQASLLIAMLRASGVPARYVHGALETARAQELLLSMFAEPTGVVGHVPADAEVGDPANDPDLLAETQDHWWVEAYLPGLGWTALDPSFADAQPGDAFASANETLAEIHDSLRHKVTLSVKVEQSSQLSAAIGDFSITVPLSATFNSVELVGNPITLGHFVDSSGAGIVIANYQHVYTPYFSFLEDDVVIVGDSYQDVLTNFPLGSQYVTGVWLIVESMDADGHVAHYERTIKDLIGLDMRLTGGHGDLNRGDAAMPLISQSEIFQLHVVPHSHLPISVVERRQAMLLAVAPALSEAVVALEGIDASDAQAIADYAYTYAGIATDAQAMVLDLLAASYQAAATASERAVHSKAMLVHSYPDRSKLLLLAQETSGDTAATSFELLNNRERALAYPGQSSAATISATFSRSVADKLTEY